MVAPPDTPQLYGCGAALGQPTGDPLITPGTLTVPLIQTHLLLVLPQPFTPCTHTLYPELPANAPNCAYTWLVVVSYGPDEKGPPILLLNKTTPALVPVVHEYRIFCPFTVFIVISDIVPLHASNDATGLPTVLEGGAELTNTMAVPVEVPPAGQFASDTAVTV